MDLGGYRANTEPGSQVAGPVVHRTRGTSLPATPFQCTILCSHLLLHFQVQAYEIPQIAAAVAELSDSDQIPITYMVVRKRHNTRYGWPAIDIEFDSSP